MPTTPTNSLSADELRFLQEAADYLEHPSFLLRVANLLGKPAEALLEALPEKAQSLVNDTTSTALHSALDWAVRSLPRTRRLEAPEPKGRGRMGRHLHTAAAATTGAVGGFFGLAGLAVEVPATTTIMLRSIAEIAAETGADLSDPDVQLQCLSVFSFGSPSLEKMESAYISGRLGMAMAVKDAAAFVARHTAREVSDAVAKGTGPVIVRLINQIASRFQVVVSQKVAAQAIPVAGAAAGALINAAFTDHFNTVARYHFGIVRLEKMYGKEVVQAAYQASRQTKVLEANDA